MYYVNPLRRTRERIVARELRKLELRQAREHATQRPRPRQRRSAA